MFKFFTDILSDIRAKREAKAMLAEARRQDAQRAKMFGREDQPLKVATFK